MSKLQDIQVMTGSKKKRLSIAQKAEILQLVDQKVPYNKITEMFNISGAAISKIKSKKAVIEQYESNGNLEVRRINGDVPKRARICTSLVHPLVSQTNKKDGSLQNYEDGSYDSLLLKKASEFLHHRLMGIDSLLHEAFNVSSAAYECTKRDDIVNFLINHDFHYPIQSIRADRQRCSVTVDYVIGKCISTEILFFTTNFLEIVYIQTFYNQSVHSIPSKFVTASNSCNSNGEDATRDSIDTSCSISLLKLGALFLEADTTRDFVRQQELMAEDIRAFGCQGKTAVITAQQDSKKKGIYYTLPFAVQVNIEAQCLVLDFYAHTVKRNEEVNKQRGTDIMYMDLVTEKVLRIDTVRHCMEQPDWVRKQFANDANLL